MAAASHGESTRRGDHKAANANADLIATAYTVLKERGLESQQMMLPLLDDQDASVRSWAASHALEFASSPAEATLRHLVENDSSIVGFNAKMTLREWRAGRLAFPPFAHE